MCVCVTSQWNWPIQQKHSLHWKFQCYMYIGSTFYNLFMSLNICSHIFPHIQKLLFFSTLIFGYTCFCRLTGYLHTTVQPKPTGGSRPISTNMWMSRQNLNRFGLANARTNTLPKKVDQVIAIVHMSQNYHSILRTKKPGLGFFSFMSSPSIEIHSKWFEGSKLNKWNCSFKNHLHLNYAVDNQQQQQQQQCFFPLISHPFKTLVKNPFLQNVPLVSQGSTSVASSSALRNQLDVITSLTFRTSTASQWSSML